MLVILTAVAWGNVLVAPAAASPALAQHASKDAGVTVSSSLAFPVNNTAGNWTGVVIRAGHSGQVLAVSDSRGNIYRQALQFNETLDTPNGETVAIYYAENIAGGANTVTVSESISSNTLRFAILEYSGLATSNSLDATVAAQGTGTALNSGTATTTIGGDLVLTALVTANGATYTAGSGFTIEERVPAAPSTKLMVEDGIQGLAGGVSASATLAAADNWGAGLAAFKAASGVLPPSISSLNPTSGPVGSQVTIAGSNFGTSQGSSTVTFGGVSAGIAGSWTTTSIVVTVPSGATSGNVVVTVGGIASNGVAFTVLPTPSITNLNPTSGSIGTTVTITGSNFGASQGTSTVTFNGTAANPTLWSNTGITVPVPVGATTGNVVVTASGLASNGIGFTVVPTPTITNLNPPSGPIGSIVVITGTNFGVTQGASTVTFNGASAGVAGSWGATSIVVSVPVAATSGNVVITVGGVASNGLTFTIGPDVTPPTAPSNLVASASSGVSIQLSWTPSTDNVAVGNYLIEQCQGVGCTNFTQNQPLSGNTSPLVFIGPLAPATSYSFRMRAKDTTGNLSGYSNTASATTQSLSITNLSPTSGVVGTSVTITGASFGASQGAGTVTFNGAAATPTSWSDTSIVVTVPTGATTGPVLVTVGGVVSNVAPFTVLPLPNIVSVTPVAGGVGTLVTISGTNFGTTQGSSGVTFFGTSGSISQATPTTWSDTTIVVLVPSGATTGTIVVRVGLGNSNGVAFTVTPAIRNINPTSGPVGTSVLITGANFGTFVAGDAVTFNGTPVTTIQNWNDTSASVLVPSGATTGPVVVTAGGFASNSVSFTVTPVTITNLSPTSGPVSTLVTITGTNFGPTQGTSSLSIGGVTATPTSWSQTNIVAPVPISAITGTIIVNVGGISSNGATFTVTSPNISGLSPNNGPVGTSVTVTGANFGSSQGTGTVTFNGTTATPTSWSSTSIVVPVPTGATNGNVVVSVGGVSSNGVYFAPNPPSISALNPTSGLRGSSLTITGVFFGASQGASIVSFAGTNGTPTSWSDTSITVPVPAGAAYGNDLLWLVVNGVGSNNVVFTVLPPSPSIASLNPSSGTVGTSVVITGTNFGATQGSSTVAFNGALATPTSWSDISITVLVPSAATTGNVVVTEGGVPSNGVPFSLIPNISSLSPASGSWGSTVTITGSGLGQQGPSAVTFNGIPSIPSIWNATSITTQVPTAATTGPVVVSTVGGTSTGVTFTVVPAITGIAPTSGPTGTLVTIFGTSFGATQGMSTVTFNGVAATPASWSATNIVVPVPSGATTGKIIVNVGGVATNGVDFETVSPGPTVSGLSPTLGPVGTSVTIAGAGFGATQGTSTILFSGIAATPANWSDTNIVAPVPTGAATGNVVVTVGGQASNGSNFTVTVPSATITLVQHTSKDPGTTTSSSLAFQSNNAAGNWIAVVVRAGRSGQILTVSDSLHNTYRTAAQMNVTVDTPKGDTLGVFYAENIVGGPNTVTVSDTISGTLRFAIFEYSGVAPANSLDVASTNQSTSNSPNSGNATTTANGDLLLGALMTGNSATYTAGSGYKIEEFVPAEPNSKLIAEDQIQSAAGIASAAATLSASDQWGAILAAFKAGNSTAATSPTITGLNPTFGPVGTAVTISGTNFGASQGTSTIAFNGAAATPSSWSATSIVAMVPAAATTGTVVVTVGGTVSNGVTFGVVSPPPSITSLSPSSAVAGSGPLTLTVTGTNFVPSSTVQWNGTARSTVFVSTMQLQATITAADVASTSIAVVTVSNVSVGGGVSSISTFFIGTAGGNNFASTVVNQAAQDIVYDPKNQLFYLSVPGTAATGPNSIAVLDPATGTIPSPQPAGVNPNVLAISDDSQFLYAGIDGASSVQRFLLPSLARDISYGLGSGSLGPYFALDLQVAPAAPHTTAVTLANAGVIPAAQGGITIFDDASPRATTAPGNIDLFDSLQWGSDATTLFAANYESSGFDFYTLTVSPSGVSLARDFPNTFSSYSNRIHFDPGTKLVYADDGHVINPTTGQSVGQFAGAGPMVPDSTLNLAFFANAGNGGTVTIQSFDLTHFSFVNSIRVSNVNGFPKRLIRWGQNGLAFNTDAGQIVLIGGNFVH